MLDSYRGAPLFSNGWEMDGDACKRWSRDVLSPANHSLEGLSPLMRQLLDSHTPHFSADCSISLLPTSAAEPPLPRRKRPRFTEQSEAREEASEEAGEAGGEGRVEEPTRGEETLADKVKRICAALELDAGLSMREVIRQANELMELENSGRGLPSQANALLAKLGV